MKRSQGLVQLFAILILTLGLPAAVNAQDSGQAQVTMEVTGGFLTYGISGATMTPITFDYSRAEQSITRGSVTLTVDDARGTLEGWAIVLEATDFTYTGVAPGNNDIPASRATVLPKSPTLLAGHGLNGIVAGGSGPLDTRRTVISAASGSGSGAFSQELEILLDIPAHSPSGTYTTLLTVSTSAAPADPA